MNMDNCFETAIYPWIPDVGDGTFRNPVIHADYSDPDVIRSGDDFYMVASSFNCTPGLPILHSRDLVNWTLINHAIRNVPHPRYSAVQPGCGVWAPAIREHDGKFWIFFPMPDEGIYVTFATDPASEWSEPWCLQEAKGWIDPCPFWDDDGKAWLFHAYAMSRSGKKERIHCRPMSPDCRQLLGEGKELFHTPHHLYLEGPKVHKLNGWYYILAPGGGVPAGWQVVFRSRDIFGPYEEKIVLERGSTPINGPHQGALIDLQNGEWRFMHFQDAGPFGRIVHMQPVRWHEDWPLMGVDHDGNGIGEPVATWQKPAIANNCEKAIPQTDDEFDAPKLGLQWQWHANHEDSWASLSARPGWLRLHSLALPGGNLSRAPHFLGQKFPARTFAAETLLDYSAGGRGEIAGLAIVGGNGHAALALRRTIVGDEFVFLLNGEPERIGFATSCPVRMRVVVAPDAGCTFEMATAAGPFAALRHTFHVGGGDWIGAKVGLFSLASGETTPAGHADFDYLRFSPPSKLSGAEGVSLT
jgi:beta-xylosidase